MSLSSLLSLITSQTYLSDIQIVMSQYRYLILTATELEHIDYLLDMNHRDGIYWGNYDQYQKRADRIKNKIKDAIDRVNVESQKKIKA